MLVVGLGSRVVDAFDVFIFIVVVVDRVRTAVERHSLCARWWKI